MYMYRTCVEYWRVQGLVDRLKLRRETIKYTRCPSTSLPTFREVTLWFLRIISPYFVSIGLLYYVVIYKDG